MYRRTTKAKAKMNHVSKTDQICSQLLQIVTCSIRNPNARIRKVSLTNETQKKIKRRVSNKKHTVSRPVFVAAHFRNQVSTKKHQIFSTMRVSQHLQEKQVFSGMHVFPIHPREHSKNIPRKKKKSPQLQHIFQTLKSHNFNPNFLTFKKMGCQSWYHSQMSKIVFPLSATFKDSLLSSA